MSVFDKVQPLVSSEDGKLYDLAFNTDEISFEILELTYDEMKELISDIETQITLLNEAYRSSREETT